MKKNPSKVLALLLAVVMVLALVPAAALAAEEKESTYADTTDAAIETWSGYGVVNGDGTGKFNPDGKSTRGEGAALISGLLKLTDKADVSAYTDLPATAWYTEHFAKAVAAGIFSGNGTQMLPAVTLTREQYFVVMANALGIEPAKDTTALDAFTDGTSVSSWAAKTVAALVEDKYIAGTGDGKLSLGANVTRQNMVQLVDNLVEVYANEAGTYNVTTKDATGTTKRVVLVVADGVKLTGTPSGRILVSAKDAKVDFTGLTGKADIYVIQDGATLTGVPAGSTVDFGGEVKEATVNGSKVDATKAEDFTVPTAPATTDPSASTSPAPSESTTPETPADTTTALEYTVYVVDGDVDVIYTTNDDTKILKYDYSIDDDTLTLTVSSDYEVVSASFNGTAVTFTANEATVSTAKLDGKYELIVVVKKK